MFADTTFRFSTCGSYPCNATDDVTTGNIVAQCPGASSHDFWVRVTPSRSLGLYPAAHEVVFVPAA